MNINVDNLSKDFERKLKRSLKNNEVEFVKWMVKYCDNPIVPYSQEEQSNSKEMKHS